MSGAWPYVAAILPTILVATFFYFIVKSIIEGDRRERIAQKKYEQEQEREPEHSSRAAVAGSDAAVGSDAAAETGDAGPVAEPESTGKGPSES